MRVHNNSKGEKGLARETNRAHQISVQSKNQPNKPSGHCMVTVVYTKN